MSKVSVFCRLRDEYGKLTGFSHFTDIVGADYQLSSGNTVLDARYSLMTNDGEYILVRNCGPFGAMVPYFETRTGGAYGYLNQNRYLSSDPGVGAGGVSLTFYEQR